MTLGTELLIGTLFLSGSIILVIAVTTFLKARRLERLRQKQLLVDFWQSKAEEIYAALQQFRSFLRSENGYFAKNLLTSWKEKYTRLLVEIKDKPSAGLDQLLQYPNILKTAKTSAASSIGNLYQKRSKLLTACFKTSKGKASITSKRSPS
jgi:hypothetical protein